MVILDKLKTYRNLESGVRIYEAVGIIFNGLELIDNLVNGIKVDFTGEIDS